LGPHSSTAPLRASSSSSPTQAVPLSAPRSPNRAHFTLLYSPPREKNPNTQLNPSADRRQNIFIANYYRQDFIFPGYTAQLSVHYNHDQKTFHFDENGFLVRPDAAGVFTPHNVNVAYLGWAGDGHIGPINITHQFYWALGYDD